MKGNQMPHFQDTHPWNPDAKPGTPSYRRWQHNPRENSTIRILRTLVDWNEPTDGTIGNFVTEVSTVCLGLQYPLDGEAVVRDNNQVLIFETSVFGGSLSGYTQRNTFLNDAITTHDKVVRMVTEEERSLRELKKRGLFQRIVSWVLYGIDFRK